MLRTLALVLLIAVASCTSTRPAPPLRSQSLTPAETEQVDSLLEKLYQSFSYEEGEEPDWELMRSVFIDGAQFVGEPPVGEAPNPQSVDAFISSWQTSIRRSTSASSATDEWITGRHITKVGQLISVDVTFQAIKQNDPAPRKPGLDSLVLVSVGDVWKILSFVVQYESKL
jgi:hypothetical protein